MGNKQKVSSRLEDIFIGQDEETILLVKKLHHLIQNSNSELKREVHFGGKEPYVGFYAAERKQMLFSVQLCPDHLKLYFHNIAGKDLSSFPELEGTGRSMRHVKLHKGKTLNEMRIIELINHFAH